MSGLTTEQALYLLDRIDNIQALLMFICIVIIAIFIYKFLRMFF